MIHYPVGDFLIRVKNASLAKRKEVTVPNTKLISSVAKVLKKEGFLDEVKIEKGVLSAQLTFAQKRPRLLNVKLVSKPGLRIYKSAKEVEGWKKSPTLILSTSQGILSLKDAKKKRVGGEVIAEVL